MKKTLFFLLCTFLFLHFSLPVKAQVHDTYIGDGYTTEGIHYTIYNLETESSTQRAVGDTIDVTRQFVFEGTIQPALTRTYTEKIGTVTYTGTLKLSYFYPENGYTYATYKGTLTAIN